MKLKILVFLSIFVISCFGCLAAEAPSCSKLIEYAEHQLPHWGVLKNSDGFVYVDLDDDYIHQLVGLIDGYEEPPYFEGMYTAGAHISVIYPNEKVGEIEECGQMIPFTIKDCQVVHPPRWKEIDEVYFIVVEAPELDALRMKYGLPKREYEFHITIGIKKQSVNQ